MIQPEQIFKNYDQVKDYVDDLVAKNEVDKMNELARRFAKYLIRCEPGYQNKELKNVESFLITIPVVSGYEFVKEVDKHRMNVVDKIRVISEGFKYVGTIHTKLMKSYEDYKRIFYVNMMKIRSEFS